MIREDVLYIEAAYDTKVSQTSPATAGNNMVAGRDPNRLTITFAIDRPLQSVEGEYVKVGVLLNGTYTTVTALHDSAMVAEFSLQHHGQIVQGEWYAQSSSAPFPLTVVENTKIR